MGETTRFLRYIIPGSVLAFWLLLSLYLSSSDKVFAFWKPHLEQVGFAGSIALLLALLGAVGYILSNVHHALTWFPIIGRYYGIDYSRFLHQAKCNGYLAVYSYLDPQNVIETKTSYDGAWRIFTALWHGARETGVIKGATARSESLADITHSAGSAFVGSVFAFMLWYILVSYRFPNDYLWPTGINGNPWPEFIVAPVSIWLHLFTYLIAKKHFQGFNSTILANYLYDQRTRSKGFVKPVEFLAMEEDFHFENGGKRKLYLDMRHRSSNHFAQVDNHRP